MGDKNSAEHIDSGEQAWPEGIEFPGAKEAAEGYISQTEKDIQASVERIEKIDDPDAREFLMYHVEQQKDLLEKIKREIEQSAQ